MSGLNHLSDSILSLSCLLTTATLHPLEPHGFHVFIATPASTLSTMSAWCTDTHTASGLIATCLSPPPITTTASHAASDLLAYIRTYIPTPGIALLAGNSIHMDRAFLSREPWAQVLEHLHYRVLDVSSIKEGVRRWGGDEVLRGVPRKTLKHEAKDDVLESVEEARYYMGLIQGLQREREGM